MDRYHDKQNCIYHHKIGPLISTFGFFDYLFRSGPTRKYPGPPLRVLRKETNRRRRTEVTQGVKSFNMGSPEKVKGDGFSRI